MAHHQPIDRMTPESLLPLTAGDFHILLALAGGDLHGYAIMQEVQRLSEGSVRLGPGTLYRLLKVLLDRGLIAESGERPDPSHDDERRRYYRLTDFGQQVALAETRRLTRLVAQARKVPGWALSLAAHVPASVAESNDRRADP